MGRSVCLYVRPSECPPICNMRGMSLTYYYSTKNLRYDAFFLFVEKDFCCSIYKIKLSYIRPNIIKDHYSEYFKYTSWNFPFMIYLLIYEYYLRSWWSLSRVNCQHWFYQSIVHCISKYWGSMQKILKSGKFGEKLKVGRENEIQLFEQYIIDPCINVN